MKDDWFIMTIEIVFYTISVSVLVNNLPVWVSVFVLVPLIAKLYVKFSMGVCRSYRRIDGQTVIITGANSGIGLETAKDLARRGGRIILACRSMDKGMAALAEIREETVSSDVIIKQLDLNSLASIRKFASEINRDESRLDILINNAGVTGSRKVLTGDKLETLFQSNHFGHFLLTNLLLGKLAQTGRSRIVIVSSTMHKFIRSLDLDNLNSEKSWDEPILVYGRTKLANILFSNELHRRLQAAQLTDISVNSLHPGAVRTRFGRHLEQTAWYLKYTIPVVDKLFFKSAKEGAQTSIYVAVSEELDGLSGKYFSDCEVSDPSSMSTDSVLAKELWEKSAQFVGLKREETILWE